MSYESYRTAFHNFDIEKVAAMTPTDVDQLLGDTLIIRNRRKIEAVINNARLGLADPWPLAEMVWAFKAAEHEPPAYPGAGPTTSVEATALAKELKRRGYKFVGPSSTFAFLENIWVINDHIRGCYLAETS